MINTIIFDLDGTLYNETDVKMMAELSVAIRLCDYTNFNVEIIYSTFRKAKKKIINKYKGLPEANDRNKWYYETLKELQITNITNEELSEHYWHVIYNNMKPYEDFIYILPELQKKYKLYVLTDELSEIHKCKLRCLGLDNVFVKTLSAEQVGETKPSEKLFKYAISEIGEPRRNILVVGDNPAADIKGGNGVGVRTAWLKRGKYCYYQKSKEESPCIEFINYVQLIRQIENL